MRSSSPHADDNDNDSDSDSDKAPLQQFWSCLGPVQQQKILTVRKADIRAQVQATLDLDLLETAFSAIEGHIAETISRETSSPPVVVWRLSEGTFVPPPYPHAHSSASPRNPTIAMAPFASLVSAGDFVCVSAEVSRAINSLCYATDDGVRSAPLPIQYAAQRLALQFLDILTFPKPARKFHLVLDYNLTVRVLREMLNSEVGMNDVDKLVLLSKGKEIGRDKDHLTVQQLGLSTKSKIIISKRLGTSSSSDSDVPVSVSERNKQFVGDLLFGSSTGTMATDGNTGSNSIVSAYTTSHGYQILGQVLERLVTQRIASLYEHERKARESEAELIRLLELEENSKNEEELKKKKKNKKKKDRERRRKETGLSPTDTHSQKTQSEAGSGGIPDSDAQSNDSDSDTVTLTQTFTAATLVPKTKQPLLMSKPVPKPAKSSIGEDVYHNVAGFAGSESQVTEASNPEHLKTGTLSRKAALKARPHGKPDKKSDNRPVSVSVSPNIQLHAPQSICSTADLKSPTIPSAMNTGQVLAVVHSPTPVDSNPTSSFLEPDTVSEGRHSEIHISCPKCCTSLKKSHRFCFECGQPMGGLPSVSRADTEISPSPPPATYTPPSPLAQTVSYPRNPASIAATEPFAGPIVDEADRGYELFAPPPETITHTHTHPYPRSPLLFAPPQVPVNVPGPVTAPFETVQADSDNSSTNRLPIFKQLGR